MGWGLLTLKNDPTCTLVPRVVIKYSNSKLKNSGSFRFDDTLTKLVAWLHEPQPNVLQKVRQNTFLELS